MFLWVANFRGLIAGFARLPTLLRTFIFRYICLTKNTGFFTRGGIYPYLLYPTHVFFISLFFYAIVKLILDVVPIYRAHHRTPNTMSIYHVLMTKEQNISIYGYIGTWILRKYRKYRKISENIGGYFDKNIDNAKINKNILKFMEILC